MEGQGDPPDMQAVRHSHLAVYDANAKQWDRDRGRTLFEKPWLDRLLAHIQAGGDILDLGCGTGDPIARYLMDRGYSVTGQDFSAAMLAIAQARFPQGQWIEGDMRHLDLARRFGGIVAWDSFFHLSRDEQRAMIPRLAAHLRPGGALLVTIGPEDGEVLGRVGSGAVYHASLSPDEYAERLGRAGLEIECFRPNDPDCGGHSVLLAVARGAVCGLPAHRKRPARRDRAGSRPQSIVSTTLPVALRSISRWKASA